MADKVNGEKESEKELIKQLEDRVKQIEGDWKRAIADYRNLKKRAQKEKEEFAVYANRRLLAELLSVRDALEKANSELTDDGVSLILKQLDEIFKNEGVEKIEVSESEEFSPELMEAIDTAETDDEEKKNKVAQVYRDGFMYKDMLLRPAAVAVYKSQKHENTKTQKHGNTKTLEH